MLHLSPNERWPDQPVGKQFQIQLLNEIAQGVAVGYVGKDENTLEVSGILIPVPVIEAARRQPVGKGDFVNRQGESVLPWESK